MLFTLVIESVHMVNNNGDVVVLALPPAPTLAHRPGGGGSGILEDFFPNQSQHRGRKTRSESNSHIFYNFYVQQFM